jgi:hypothetical protein
VVEELRSWLRLERIMSLGIERGSWVLGLEEGLESWDGIDVAVSV